MYISKFLVLFVIVSSISSTVQESPLKVVLYYESLCPYCHDFIMEQLYPGYLQLGDSIFIDLVSFGKAYSNKTSDGIKWTCQHGPVECYLNKIHACVINSNYTQLQVLSFVNCTVSETDRQSTEEEAEVVSKQCAEDNQLSWSDILNCSNDGTGDKLLLAYEDRQNKLDRKIDHVPDIRFNDVYDEETETEAEFDFVWTCCQLFTDNIPEVCDEQLKKIKKLIIT